MASIIDRAKALRPTIETLAATLNDTAALDNVELFKSWDSHSVPYVIDERVRYNGVLYKCLQAHTSQATWEPDVAVSLWAKVLIPDPEVIPEWEQPTSTNAYSRGDKVKHNQKIWESDYDNNVWEPGVFGWSEVL